MSYELATCPVCASARSRVIADAEQLKAQQEDLWRFQLRRRVASVPPEQLYDRAFFTQAPPLQLVECDECGTLYRNPRERADQLVEEYAGEALDERVYRQLFEAQCANYKEQATRLTEVAGRCGSGVELGSYVGAFLSAARAKGWQFEGVDVNEAANRFASQQGFTVRRGGLEAVTGRQFDAVAIWNCFDQLPDPRATAAAARNVLHPGGILAIRVPNGELYARLARSNSGGGLRRLLLAYNNLLSFPYRQGFTPASLTRLLEDQGFEIVRHRPDVLVPTADRWTRPWARAEERWLKRLLRWARLPAWFEVYARKVA
jgi:SAM-dependent methyltransferase